MYLLQQKVQEVSCALIFFFHCVQSTSSCISIQAIQWNSDCGGGRWNTEHEEQSCAYKKQNLIHTLQINQDLFLCIATYMWVEVAIQQDGNESESISLGGELFVDSNK